MATVASVLRFFLSQQALVEFEPASPLLRHGVDGVLLGVEKGPDQPQRDHPPKIVCRSVVVQICRVHHLVLGRRPMNKAFQDGSDDVSPRPFPNPVRQVDNTAFAKRILHFMLYETGTRFDYIPLN